MKARKGHSPAPAAGQRRRPFPSAKEGNGLFLSYEEEKLARERRRLKKTVCFAEVMAILAAVVLLAAFCRYCWEHPTLPDSTAYVDVLSQRLAALPNTCWGCMLHSMGEDSDIYLLYLNTGTAYDISVYEGRPAQDFHGYCLENRGDDPYTGTSHTAAKNPDAGTATVRIAGIDGIALAPKMLKSLYCDDCLRRLLAAVRGHPAQVVIVDPTDGALYPIAYGRGQTANHRYNTKADGEKLRITVREK